MHECNTCSVRTVSDSSRRTCLIFSKVILDCFRISELCVDLYLMDILSHDCITEFCSSKILRDFQLPPSRSRSPLAKEVPMARAQGHGNILCYWDVATSCLQLWRDIIPGKLELDPGGSGPVPVWVLGNPRLMYFIHNLCSKIQGCCSWRD